MDSASLKAFLQQLTQRPELEPGNGVTHCNQAARETAQFIGCHEFDDLNLLADDLEQIMRLNISNKWEPCDGSTAANRAMIGGLVFAVKTSKELGEEHGHIAAIFSSPMQFSGSLNTDVPMCANVGKRNGVMKVSEAFPVAKGEPAYYTYAISAP